MSVSRVIEVSFGGGSIAYAKVDTAYFYNNGIIFKPTDIDLPASYQVHWADSPQASSTLETIGTAEGAPIPDDLWNRSRVIYGWIYLHPTEDSGVTGYEVRIYKNVRAGLPDGTEPTPAEQSTIDQLIGALNSAVEQTGEDVESAEQAKDDAESARDNAQTYANNAQTSAQASARSAESASESARVATEKATASAESASQSAQIKADVESLADDAQGYADSASQSASQASASEQGCARAVLDAASAAAIARARADEASGYAQTASAKAQNASQSASTASQKATEASQSATNASQSAQTAESAKTASQTAQGLAESARDSAISAKNDTESARNDAVQAKEDAESAVASISGALDDKAPVITDTASGSIASFSDGADDLPLKSLVVDINPVQDLSHGDPSPENICPISGWTEVDVEQSGKNLFDKSVVELGALKADGTVLTTGSTKYVSGYIRISPNTSYYLSNVIPATDGRSGFWYDADKNPIEAIIRSPYTLTSFAVVSPSNAEYVRIGCYIASADICQLEAGSTATPYSPYTGRSITISLGQTVYGGKLDVLTGILTVYPYYASYNGETLTGEWISDRDVYAVGTTPTIGAQVVNIGAQGVTVQLEPYEVESLYGVNNLWADSGDTEAEYRADTKTWVQRKIAEALASLT